MQVRYLFVLITLAIANTVYADDPHHNEGNTTILYSRIANGQALGLAASALNFDARTYDLQGSVGIGGYDGNNAIFIGIGKRIGKGGMLLNGGIGTEEGKTGYNAGLSFKFKWAQNCLRL